MKPEPPEKKSSPPPHSPPSPSSSPSFSSLPDEITASYLARIPMPYYPRLSIISKSFQSLISSTELYEARSHLGRTEQCLYVSVQDSRSQFPNWFTLWINPNTQRKKENTTGQLLVPIPSPSLPTQSKSMVSIGSEVYVIGGPIDGAPAAAVRILDCRTHTWRNGPRMIVSRNDAAACVHDGKIYVLGGWEELKKDEPWAEVFDPKTQIWECLPDPGTEIPKHNFEKIYEIEGKLIFRGKKSGDYAYDPKRWKWERCENIGAVSELVVGNVSYLFNHILDGYRQADWYALWWSSSVKKSIWRVVKGLKSLLDKYKSSCGGENLKIVSSAVNHKLVWCGGKLYLIWEAVKLDKKKIWCAEIVLEKRNRNGGEIWGEVKWVDVVLTVSMSCQLLQCIAVTV